MLRLSACLTALEEAVANVDSEERRHIGSAETIA